MSIFESFLRGRQAAQAQALNQLKLQQAQQMFPIEQQLQQLQMERARQQLALGQKELEAGPRGAKFGRVFQAMDPQGKSVFAQADDQGGVKIVEGLTPPDLQQQRIDLQREIATGKAEREEKEFITKTQDVKEKKQADINALSNTITQIDSLINDPDFGGAVGLIDQFTARAGAAFGTKEGVVNRRAKRVLNNSIVKIAKSLGANPTDRDMKILAETQPNLSDPPNVWQDWYKNDLLPTINSRLRAFGQPELGGGEQTETNIDDLVNKYAD